MMITVSFPNTCGQPMACSFLIDTEQYKSEEDIGHRVWFLMKEHERSMDIAKNITAEAWDKFWEKAYPDPVERFQRLKA